MPMPLSCSYPFYKPRKLNHFFSLPYSVLRSLNITHKLYHPNMTQILITHIILLEKQTKEYIRKNFSEKYFSKIFKKDIKHVAIEYLSVRERCSFLLHSHNDFFFACATYSFIGLKHTRKVDQKTNRNELERKRKKAKEQKRKGKKEKGEGDEEKKKEKIERRERRSFTF